VALRASGEQYSEALNTVPARSFQNSPTASLLDLFFVFFSAQAPFCFRSLAALNEKRAG